MAKLGTTAITVGKLGTTAITVVSEELVDDDATETTETPVSFDGIIAVAPKKSTTEIPVSFDESLAVAPKQTAVASSTKLV